MFEVGFTEILLIFGIALLVLGPEKLPKLAADVGRWAGRARAMARQLRTQLEQETQFNPLSGINTDLNAGSPAAAPNSIHTPPHAAEPPPAAEPGPVDDASRAAPLQVAEQATPAAVTDATPAAGQDGR
jgi:sec-independent protein translocase protein TatB